MLHNLKNQQKDDNFVVVIIFGINVPNNLEFSEPYRKDYFAITFIIIWLAP